MGGGDDVRIQFFYSYSLKHYFSEFLIFIPHLIPHQVLSGLVSPSSQRRAIQPLALSFGRAIATRYEKYDANFLALVKLATERIRLRVYWSMS